jgi:hypothetical protein
VDFIRPLKEVENTLEEYDLLQCIDRGLEAFGSHVKQTIYWRISMRHGSLHNGIAADPKVFVTTLREMFGDSSIGVEDAIIRQLEETFILKDHDCIDLTLALEAACKQVTPSYTSAPLMSMRLRP